MSWPLASHFSAMLQNPKVAFRDPRLRLCQIEKDNRRQPRPWAGAFAVVYKGIHAGHGEPFAVRVFTTESPERRERYGQISAYLKGRKLKCLCDFEYRDESIRSAGDGKWYPLIIMEWVQGDTLFKWARARCLEGNTAELAAAAGRWVELVGELAEVSVTHGDLQHANVMVTDAGELKLVDYDCMCVPALVGRRNLEVGVEPYQHPARNETTLLSLDLDNFSAIVIYVALKALAGDPGLWQKHVETTGYDKLLFRPEDFRAPAESPLYHDLMRSPEQDVRDLTGQLFSFYHGAIDRVPPLPSLANSFVKVEQLLLQQDWQAAVDALNRRGQFRDAPEHLKPLIHQAYEEVCRQRAWEAFACLPPETSEVDDRKLVDTWNEVLFAGYEPAERQRVRMAGARRRVTLLDRLRYLVQQSSGTITLAGERAIADASAALPQGYRHSLQARVDQARRCVAAVGRLKQVLEDPVSEAAIMAAWRAVVKARCEELADPDWRPRIELAERRAPLIRALGEIPPTETAGEMPLDQRDGRILELWQEDLLADCREADRWREAHRQAVARAELLDKLQAAIGDGDEAAIGELMHQPCLADYPLPAEWVPAVNAARDRVGRCQAMVTALRDGKRSKFHESFDARIIRRYPEEFSPYQSLLREWTTAEVMPLDRLGLQPAVARQSVVPLRGSQNGYRVRWTWPQPRFADECLLAVCGQRPGDGDDPQDLTTHLRLPIDRESWERGGGSRVVRAQPQWIGSYVVVWALVCLGEQTLTSPPLVLGRLEGRRRRSWKGLGIFSFRRTSTEDTPDGQPAEDEQA